MGKEIVAYLPSLDAVITLRLTKSKNIRVRCNPLHQKLVIAYFNLSAEPNIIYMGEL